MSLQNTQTYTHPRSTPTDGSLSNGLSHHHRLLPPVLSPAQLHNGALCSVSGLSLSDQPPPGHRSQRARSAALGQRVIRRCPGLREDAGVSATLVLTGKGSAPSWITKPSMRWVRTWGATTACAALLSPLCWLLLVFPFPEVMTGAQAAPHLSTQAAWQT